VQLVVSLCPRFKRVYTNEPLTRLLFEEAGFEVIAIPFFKREVFEGTKIRALMAEGGDWRSFVPSAVAKVIDDIRGAERVSYLFQLEEKSKIIQKTK
jgi:nicotinamide-nucleotide adenylyltransferase